MTPRQQRIHAEQLSYWRPHIVTWRESGLSAKVYCEQHGLRYAGFKYWRAYIAPETKTPKKKRPLSEAFTEITPRQTLLPDTSGFELWLPKGIILKIPVPCAAQDLMNIVKSLSCVLC